MRTQLSDTDIQNLADKLKGPLTVAGIEKFNRSNASEENAYRVAKFMLMYMPEVVDYLNNDPLARPRSANDHIHHGASQSPFAKMLAVVGAHTSSQNSDLEEDAYFASVQKDIFFKEVVINKADNGISTITDTTPSAFMLPESLRVRQVLPAHVKPSRPSSLLLQESDRLPETKSVMVAKHPDVNNRDDEGGTQPYSEPRFSWGMAKVASLAAALAFLPLPVNNIGNLSLSSLFDKVAGIALFPNNNSVTVASSVVSGESPDVLSYLQSSSTLQLVEDNGEDIILPNPDTNVARAFNLSIPAVTYVSQPLSPQTVSDTFVLSTKSIEPTVTNILQSDFTFEQIPDVIAAYYEREGVDISPNLKNQFAKFEDGLTNGKKGHVEMAAFDSIKLLVSQFGSTALPLANIMLDKTIETETNNIRAENLSRGAKQYWNARFPA